MNQRQNGLIGTGRMHQKLHAMPFAAIPAAFFLVEVFGFVFLSREGMALWSLAFGVLWACGLSGILRMLPVKASRILFGITYYLFAVYAGIQTGYYQLFRGMMWISDFRYAAEGSAFSSVLLSFPAAWWFWIIFLLSAGAVLLWKFPKWQMKPMGITLGAAAAAGSILAAAVLPGMIFENDRQVQYADSDFGRAQSAEAAYTNMFDPYRLYQVCGIYQAAWKDVCANYLTHLLPGKSAQQEQAIGEIDSYFAARPEKTDNAMTGIFQDKNVVFVLMESMDDFLLGEHTPTINRLMEEGINFTNFYTPIFGSVRTFNTEFCANTGSFLSSSGGYAFDYVTNSYRQSLPSLLRDRGYSAKVFHYNTPSFYSRGVFSPAMGYEEYLSYEDYVTDHNALYDEQVLFDNEELSKHFFRDGKKLNFIITRSAHLSYKYNEVLSHWGLQRYPQYKGMTGSEEEDCIYLKARLVDDLFARLLEELEANSMLEDTVIVAFTDHYAYGFSDKQRLQALSGVDAELLLEKTPCFIWSADGPAVEVTKTLNTADLLPTLLNLLGVDSPYPYMGSDAFDERYIGYALFPDGSWVCDGAAYSSKQNAVLILQPGKTVTGKDLECMAQINRKFVHINNLILETDYYAQK